MFDGIIFNNNQTAKFSHYDTLPEGNYPWTVLKYLSFCTACTTCVQNACVICDIRKVFQEH